MAQYTQFRLQDIRVWAHERLGNNFSFFRDDEIDHYIREALRVWNVASAFWRGRVSMGTATPLVTWYTVPAGMVYIYRVEINGKPLGSSSLWDLDYGSATWESDVATLGNSPSTIQCWAPAGINLFALWPASFTGLETLVVEGVVPAPQPVNSTDFVDIGREELRYLLDYVEHIAQFKEGGQEFESSQELLKSFLKGAAERNAMLAASSRYRKYMGLGDEAKRPLRASNERVGTR